MRTAPDKGMDEKVKDIIRRTTTGTCLNRRQTVDLAVCLCHYTTTIILQKCHVLCKNSTNTLTNSSGLSF